MIRVTLFDICVAVILSVLAHAGLISATFFDVEAAPEEEAVEAVYLELASLGDLEGDIEPDAAISADPLPDRPQPRTRQELAALEVPDTATPPTPQELPESQPAQDPPPLEVPPEVAPDLAALAPPTAAPPELRPLDLPVPTANIAPTTIADQPLPPDQRAPQVPSEFVPQQLAVAEQPPITDAQATRMFQKETAVRPVVDLAEQAVPTTETPLAKPVVMVEPPPDAMILQKPTDIDPQSLLELTVPDEPQLDPDKPLIPEIRAPTVDDSMARQDRSTPPQISPPPPPDSPVRPDLVAPRRAQEIEVQTRPDAATPLTASAEPARARPPLPIPEDLEQPVDLARLQIPELDSTPAPTRPTVPPPEPAPSPARAAEIVPQARPERAETVVSAPLPSALPDLSRVEVAAVERPPQPNAPASPPTPVARRPQPAPVATPPAPAPERVAVPRAPAVQAPPPRRENPTTDRQVAAASPPAALPPEAMPATKQRRGADSGSLTQYTTALHTMINVVAQQNYPRQAIRRREEGAVRVRLTVGASGDLLKVDVIDDGGAPRRLVSAALAAVERAAPYPAFVNGMIPEPTVFEVKIAYKLR